MQSVLGKRRPCEWPTEAASIHTERLAAKQPLYRSVQRSHPYGDGSATPSAEGELLALQIPAAGTGLRVHEYLLTRAALVACTPEPPTEDMLRHLGCDGWCSADRSSVCFVTPGLLHLVDDDKQPGRAQAFLTDLFRFPRARGPQ